MTIRVDDRDHAAVNAALDDKDVRWGRDAAAIAAKYGDAVAWLVKALCDEAIDTSVDWKRETAMDDGIGKINAHTQQHYPWLTRGARSSLVQAFIMTWK